MNTLTRNTGFDRIVCEELGRLRARIDSLPVWHREELSFAADAVQETYEDLRQLRDWIDRMVDLGQMVELAESRVDACQRELCELACEPFLPE